MSTLRWTPERLAAHEARMRKAVDAAPVAVGSICTPRKAAQEDAKNRAAWAKLDAAVVTPRDLELSGMQPVRNAPAVAKPLKYRNKPTTDAEGVKHASKKQATRYRDLGLLMKSGEIVMLAREVRFRLPGNVQYVADHVFCNQRALMVIAELIKDGDITVEDVKSDATRKNAVYLIKKKQMRECLGLLVKEV